DSTFTYSNQIFSFETSEPLKVGETHFEKAGFKLHQNYPNPFNPKTIIAFNINKISDIKINLYNQLGEELFTLINKTLQPGNYNVELDADDLKLTSGIYFCRIMNREKSECIKMTYIK
ncbi:MAG: T9SS type A sorting domain-containing protein, partial [Ignavibacteria bacterium]|nr:T9SS type A sorting domain-containing protein [Ignavibacteria bacterium]